MLWEEERRRRAAAWREGEREVEGAPRRRNNLVECEDEEKEEKPSTSKKKHHHHRSLLTFPTTWSDSKMHPADTPSTNERIRGSRKKDGSSWGGTAAAKTLTCFFFSDSTENVGGCESATHLHLLLCSFFQSSVARDTQDRVETPS